MNNTALNIEKLYSAREAATIIGKHLTTITRSIESGRLEASIENGNGGDQYRITESALIKYAAKKNINLNLSNHTHDAIPTSEQGLTTLVPAQGFSLMDLNSKRLEKDVIPAKAKEIAFARQDVLNAWEEFREKAEKKTQAAANGSSQYHHHPQASIELYEFITYAGGNITEDSTYPETQDVSIVPSKTNNSGTTDGTGWTASASNEPTGSEAYKAVDGSVAANNRWYSSENGVGYWKIAKDSGTFNCSRVSIQASEDYADSAPKDFTIKDQTGNILKTLTRLCCYRSYRYRA